MHIKVLVFGNHKGGVGKTTSAINVAAGLNKMGYKVLLVDLDPQANLTASLGCPEASPSVYEWLKGGNVPPTKILDGMDLIPSSLNLSAAEIELSAEAGREYILKELLEPLKADYHYIIIDAPPALGLLTLNALVASDQVLIPLQAQYLAMQGLTKFTEVISKVKGRLNKSLEIGGLFLTQFNSRKVLNRNVSETVERVFGTKVFKTAVRDNIALAEAPTQGVDIFRYSAGSNGAEDYLALSEEILDRTKKTLNEQEILEEV